MREIFPAVFIIVAFSFSKAESKKSCNFRGQQFLISDGHNNCTEIFNAGISDLDLEDFPSFARDHIRSILSELWELLNNLKPLDETDDMSLSCPDEGVEMIPHPKSCRKFTLCLNGIGLTQSCAEDFEFSQERSNCVHKSESDCENPKETEQTSECDKNSTSMSLIPNKKDCSKYFLCLPGGNQFPMSCPENHHFSKDGERCMDKDEAECEIEIDREFCPNEGFKQISHPKNCKKFIACYNGIKIAELKCPSRLHFSRQKRSCIDPAEAECKTNELSCPIADDSDNLVFFSHPEECSKYFACFRGSQYPLEW